MPSHATPSRPAASRCLDDALSVLAFMPPERDVAERRVTGERVTALASRSTHESGVAMLFAASATCLLWPHLDHGPLLVWLASMSLPCIARSWLLSAYRQRPVDIRDSAHPRWAYRFCACSAASGVLWGSIAVFLSATATPAGAALIVLHASHVVLVAALLAVWMPAAIAFVLPATLTFVVALSVWGGAPFPYATPLLVLIGVAALTCVYPGAVALRAALRARVAHEERIERLMSERDHAKLDAQATSRFLAAASHDLRQPVHALDLLAGVLRSRLGEAAVDGAVGKMHRSIEALSALLEGILDLSTLDANAAGEEPGAVPLRAVLERVAHAHEMPARAKGLSLSIDTGSALAARVDPLLLERTLSNLVGNAIKFTERGGVVVSAWPDGERLILSIRDTGRGIAEAEREELFAEFRQLRRGDREEGCGLGLAIVRRLCRIMGASIELVSTPGVGSDFRLSLPLAAVDGAEPERLRRTYGTFRGRHVLVIDEARTTRDMLCATLDACGCRTSSACSTETAIAHCVAVCGQDVPEALVVDVGARGIDTGLAMASVVREEFNTDIPVVLISADVASSHARALASDGVEILHRPYAPERLCRALARRWAVSERMSGGRSPGGESGIDVSSSSDREGRAAGRYHEYGA